MKAIPGYSITEEILVENIPTLYRAKSECDHVDRILKLADRNNLEKTRQFENEIEIASNLNSEWALQPLGLERTKDFIALVYEGFQGETLEKFLKAAPLTINKFLTLAIAIAKGLASIHKKGIIHRNIHTGNILVDADKEDIKILDFEVATTMDCELSNHEVLAGNLSFSSPEQTGRMNRPVDYRTDMYSLGIVFYTMLCGQKPFESSDPLELVYSHVARTPKSPKELHPLIPEAISDIVMKMMAKLPEDRYQNMDTLKYDLERCLAQLIETNRIVPFKLGEKDLLGKFRLSNKIYGREKEISALIDVYKNVSKTGVQELILVLGYPGIGKTALIKEARKQLAEDYSFFISGKFDQYKRDIPYSTIIEAFKELVFILLSQGEEKLYQWKEKIVKALHPNTALVIDIIPQLESIVGKHPPVVKLPPQESINRFNIVFEKFIGLFSSKGRPLILFLDDLQWADPGSLKIIELIITNPERKNMLLIGAYRDTEVSEEHPLTSTLKEIRRQDGKVEKLSLLPLEEKSASDFICESLQLEEKRGSTLCSLVFEKTKGNPFFTIQFLRSLYKENLLNFDYSSSEWKWKLSKIEAKEYTDNVLDLMTYKIGKLNEELQGVLKIAAATGSGFDKKTISILTSEPEQKIAKNLAELVNEGLLTCHGNRYMFIHDRVQEVAYASIHEKGRAYTHLNIGRALLNHLTSFEKEELLYEIANHFNQGIHLINDLKEKEVIGKINFQAGKKAKGGIAYSSARRYFAQAMELLPEETWRKQYEYTFQLALERSECEYLAGNFSKADDLFNWILENSASSSDKAEVYILRSKLYQLAGRYEEAFNVAAEALRLFDVVLPSNEDDLKLAIKSETENIKVNMQGRQINELYNAPLVTSRNIYSIVALLVEAVPSSYIAMPQMFPLIVLKAVNVLLIHGNTEKSCFVYSCYGIVLVGDFSDIPTANAFSELSLRLNRKFNDEKLKGTISFIHAAFVNYWLYHPTINIPLMEEAFIHSINVGDLVYAGYNACHLMGQIIEKGENLDEVLKAAAVYKTFSRETHNDVVYRTIRQYDQFVGCLRGLTNGVTSFDDDKFSEAKSLEVFKNARFGPAIAFHHIMKQMLSFTLERYDEALEWAYESKKVIREALAMVFEATHHFYYAITLTTLYDGFNDGEKQKAFFRLKEHQKRLKLWSDHCPENFLNRYLLIEAELARIEGKNIEKIMSLYDKSILSAYENGFIHNEAIACEKAGKFYKNKGFETISETYLQRAYSCYKKWGADAKLRLLEDAYPFLKKNSNSSNSSSLKTYMGQLDMLSLIKASQSISGEIELEALSANLMDIVVKQAGAEKAYLFLNRQHQLGLAAKAQNIENNIEIKIFNDFQSSKEHPYPWSIIKHVEKSGEKIIIEDATLPHNFSNDEFIALNPIRSIACLPILRQKRLIGILYLENNLFPGAFSEDKINLLELLASQAAISIENAFLFKDLNHTQKQLQDLMDNSPAVIDMKKPDGSYIFINREYERRYHLSRDKVVGMTPHDIWPQPFADMIYDHDRKVLEAGHPITFEEEEQLEGENVTFVSLRFPLYDSSGHIYCICDISLDITDRKRAEEEIRKMNQELLDKNQRLEQFGYMTSHNFRGPVASLLGLCQVIDKGRLTPDNLLFIEKIEETALKIDVMIKDLSRLLDHEKDLETLFQPVNLAEVFEDVKILLAQEIKENNVTFIIDFSAVPVVYAIPAYINSIFYNLINNAIKYRKVDVLPVIEAHSILQDNFICVTFRDNGQGIDIKRHANNLFRPFKRFNTNTQGKGLGLYLVKTQMKAMNGEIEVESENGLGTTFKLLFKER